MRLPILYHLRLRLASIAAAVYAALLAAGCILGGTGTDTENGVLNPQPTDPNRTVQLTGISARVVDGAGVPLRGVSLKLYLPAFRPDSPGAQPDPLVDSAKALLSDSSGYVAIRLRAAGKFVVEGVSAGQTVFFDTLAVPDLNLSSLFTFRTRAVKAFAGKVKLASGMRVDSGSVFIRGTARSARVDSAGNYDLGSLPEDVGRMALGLRFSSSPTSVRQVTSVAKPPIIGIPIVDTGEFMYTCQDVPKDSAARIASVPVASAAMDTGTAFKAALDTAKVNSALKSCDTLAKGGLINVVRSTPGAGKQDSVGVPLLVLSDAKPVSSAIGTYVSVAVVIPYAECIPSAGRERTSFDLQLQPAGGGSDILIRDVAEKCLDK